MSYRDKPVIDGQLSFHERRKSSMFAVLAVLFGVGAPKLVRVLADRGYLASTEALQWGTLAMSAVCIVGAILAYRSGQAQVRRDLGKDLR